MYIYWLPLLLKCFLIYLFIDINNLFIYLHTYMYLALPFLNRRVFVEDLDSCWFEEDLPGDREDSAHKQI